MPLYPVIVVKTPGGDVVLPTELLYTDAHVKTWERNTGRKYEGVEFHKLYNARIQEGRLRAYAMCIDSSQEGKPLVPMPERQRQRLEETGESAGPIRPFSDQWLGGWWAHLKIPVPALVLAVIAIGLSYAFGIFGGPNRFATDSVPETTADISAATGGGAETLAPPPPPPTTAPTEAPTTGEFVQVQSGATLTDEGCEAKPVMTVEVIYNMTAKTITASVNLGGTVTPHVIPYVNTVDPSVGGNKIVQTVGNCSIEFQVDDPNKPAPLLLYRFRNDFQP